MSRVDDEALQANSVGPSRFGMVGISEGCRAKSRPSTLLVAKRLLTDGERPDFDRG